MNKVAYQVVALLGFLLIAVLGAVLISMLLNHKDDVGSNRTGDQMGVITNK